MAGDDEKAGEMIISYFDVFYDEGKYDLLWKWLNTIDEKLVLNDYKLSYYKSLIMKFYGGDLEGCPRRADGHRWRK